MKTEIIGKKMNNKYMIGILEIPIKTGNTVATVEVLKGVYGNIFYVSKNTGMVFPNFHELAKYFKMVRMNFNNEATLLGILN